MGCLPKYSQTIKTIRSTDGYKVTGLKIEPLRRSIRWIAQVCLHQLNENSESLLSEVQWPPKSGPMYYACASTGLLFDKQSGVCLQSTKITLLLCTVKSIDGSKPGFFMAWRDKKMAMLDTQKNHGPTIASKDMAPMMIIPLPT